MPRRRVTRAALRMPRPRAVRAALRPLPGRVPPATEPGLRRRRRRCGTVRATTRTRRGLTAVIERGAPSLELARSRSEPIIARLPSAITAFVGRALKGPVHRPVTVASFAEFQHVFGGLWQPSTLSYAVEQFFDHGGGRAIIVRVANGARPPTITLPAGSGLLRLAGVNPGSREYLRESVDYDGIPEGDTDRINLVIQRVRSAGSELVEDQEIFRRASLRADSGHS